jgi:AraC-like DNA-binding protein
MIIRILPSNNSSQVDYTLEFPRDPMHYGYNTAKISGQFGSIQIMKTELLHSSIWLINYESNEELSLDELVKEQVWQVYYYAPSLTIASAASSDATVRFERTSGGSLKLPRHVYTVVVVQYLSFYFQYDNQEILKNFERVLETEYLSHDIPVNPGIEAVFSQIINASPSNPIIYDYLETKVRELLILFYQLVHPESMRRDLSIKEITALNEVRNIIMADLSRSYKIYELCKIAGTIPFTLKKNFKSWFGIPLHLYRHNCRMEKATDLLVTTTLSIKEIAFAVGYKNVSNFSESFKKHYGYAPSLVRQSE